MVVTQPNIFITIFLTSLFFSSLSTLLSQNVTQKSSWVGSKYQIECTMCAACDNPCNPNASPPPPPPPPSNPTVICPPPPSNSHVNYNSPPPPSNNVVYYPPPSNDANYYPPPSNNAGNSPPFSAGGSYVPPPAPYSNSGGPAPPNPIVGYFPFYYHSPPPPDSFSMKLVPSFALSFVVVIFCFIFVP